MDENASCNLEFKSLVDDVAGAVDRPEKLIAVYTSPDVAEITSHETRRLRTLAGSIPAKLTRLGMAGATRAKAIQRREAIQSLEDRQKAEQARRQAEIEAAMVADQSEDGSTNRLRNALRELTR